MVLNYCVQTVKLERCQLTCRQSVFLALFYFILHCLNFISRFSPVCALHPDVGMHFSANPASLTGCLGGSVCGSAHGEGLLGGVPDRNRHRVVKVWYVTVLTMMTTSCVRTDSDNAMLAGRWAKDHIFVCLSACLSESMKAWLTSSFSKLQAPLQVQWDLTPAAQSGVFCSKTLGTEYNS